MSLATKAARRSIPDVLFQGTVARSAAMRAEYPRLADALPFSSDTLMPLLADAFVALEDGEYRKALDLTQRVMPEIPPGPVGAGSMFPLRQPRALAKYALGRARFGLGDYGAARRHFETAANGGYLRLYTPFEYVRSHYYLAQIAEKSGDPATARVHYARFPSHWKNGDIDRDKIAEAIKKAS